MKNDPNIVVAPGVEVDLRKYDTAYTAKYDKKRAAKEMLEQYKEQLEGLQDKLYADKRYSLLIVFQAMDAAGKDGTIKHVMSGVNPQGCRVYSFKQPSDEELSHDFLWRTNYRTPERGFIGIFNRSYYEEVLVTRVHPELILKENIPGISSLEDVNRSFFQERYRQINDMERHLVENGTVILKFFLHLSKEEQKKRFLERIDNPAKNWKFSAGDIAERAYWDDYAKAYEQALSATSTHHAPWYIIPADNKWFTRTAVSEIIIQTLDQLNLKYPSVSPQMELTLEEDRQKLLNEK